MIYWIMDIQ